MRTGLTSLIVVVILGGVLSACYDADFAANPSAPSAFTNFGNVTGPGSLASPSLVVAAGTFQGCSPAPLPNTSFVPFSSLSVPFTVSVPTGAVPVTLSEVRVHATGPAIVASAPLVFDTAFLTREFGTVTVSSFNVGSFPLAFPFPYGCGNANAVLHVNTRTVDGNGLVRINDLEAPIR